MEKSLFMYDSTKNELMTIDDTFIDNITIASVSDVLKNIREFVKNVESNPYSREKEHLENIFICQDITFKCIAIHRWRRGFGFVFLQISLKNGGSSRMTVFTTDTVHHSASSFGTTPTASHAKSILSEQIHDTEKITEHIEILRQLHETQVSTADLVKNIQY
jgi:hypothetical protein